MATTRKTRVQNHMFEALVVERSNFFKCVNDIRTYLSAKDLDGALYQATAENMPNSWRQEALLILWRHLDHSLRKQYVHHRRNKIRNPDSSSLQTPRRDATRASIERLDKPSRRGLPIQSKSSIRSSTASQLSCACAARLSPMPHS